MAVSSSDIMQTLDLVAKVGDSFNRVFSVKNGDNSNYDFTGHTAKMQIKKYAEDETSILELLTGSGITLSSGSMTLSISALDMQIEARDYVYDIEITLPGGIIQTWYGGKFTANGDVTR